VALGIVGNYPWDLLEYACRKAQTTCTHPAKIVPFIAEYCEGSIEFRRKCYHNALAVLENIDAPRIKNEQQEYDPSDMGEVAKLMRDLVKEMEAKARLS